LASYKNFTDELMAAMRGSFALVMGKREAPSYFDLGRRGLAGSFIAVALAIVLAAYGPLLLGMSLPPGGATQSVLVNIVLFAAQAGTAYIALRQMGRQDGFVPYLVASNWITLVSALLVMLSTLLGPLGIIVLLVIILVAIASFINIGRFIVTLAPLQIGILFLSQAVGVFLALAVVAVMIGAEPPPPPA
jgi:hypothetical protein